MPRKRPPSMSPAQVQQAENKATEWTDEKLQKLLDETFSHHKSELTLSLICGALSIVVGIGLCIWAATPKMVAVGVFCILAGIIGFFVYLLKMPKKICRQQSEYAKIALQKNPEHLVWAYVQVEKEEHSSVHYWMLNFKNGSVVKIPQHVINRDMREHLREKNIEGFRNALRRLNPNIIIGYSDEVKKLYSSGLL